MSRNSFSIKKLKKLNYRGLTQVDVNLANYTTFKCGGNAKVLLIINTLENFIACMDYLKVSKTPYFVIGAGSNLLISDEGYDGVVVKLEGDFSRCELLDYGVLECGAGVKLVNAYVFARDNGLSGLEEGAGIPATIGGATYMNCSAYGFEMSKIIKYVVVYHDGKIKYLDNESCNFDYRHSEFQSNNAIILRVGLQLSSKPKSEIEEVFKKTLEKRCCSQPLEYPSAGCVFKKQDNLNVSKMLDEAGVKGMILGNAQVSEKHANFVINKGGASAYDIYSLILAMKERVRRRFDIDINTEIKLIGDFDDVTG